eukprot:SAG11_NODE_11197_length_777_cov_1.020649_1_plen_99_part_00
MVPQDRLEEARRWRAKQCADKAAAKAAKEAASAAAKAQAREGGGCAVVLDMGTKISEEAALETVARMHEWEREKWARIAAQQQAALAVSLRAYGPWRL